MARGVSGHIGLDSVDPDQYEGRSGDLNVCEVNSHDMAAIGQDAGYSTSMLRTKQASAQAVLGAFHDAAERLTTGDQPLLRYSGRGGLIPRLNCISRPVLGKP